MNLTSNHLILLFPAWRLVIVDENQASAPKCVASTRTQKKGCFRYGPPCRQGASSPPTPRSERGLRRCTRWSDPLQ